MKKILIAVLGIICFTGCATILGGGGEQNISFVSQDPDATPRVNIISSSGNQSVELPTTLKIKGSKEDISITVLDDCYKKTTQNVSSHTNPYFFGNFLLGGVIGSTTDSSSGAAWEYDNTVVVYTTPNGTCKTK